MTREFTDRNAAGSLKCNRPQNRVSINSWEQDMENHRNNHTDLAKALDLSDYQAREQVIIPMKSKRIVYHTKFT